jgi:hypothetical protein
LNSTSCTCPEANSRNATSFLMINFL